MNEVSNSIRGGNFTSSGIVALTTTGKQIDGFGAPAITYISEKNMERKLGRWLNSESHSRPTSWGNLVEKRVFDLLPTDYKLCSSETLSHPEIEWWKGSPDCEKYDEGKTIVDIKCPFTLKSFCQLVECQNAEALLELNPTYYWQLVSNACITNSKYAELIVYVPYFSELPAIRELAENSEHDIENVKWIYYALNNELPYLNDVGYYKNLNILRFEVPQESKDLLESKVILAGQHLIKRP